MQAVFTSLVHVKDGVEIVGESCMGGKVGHNHYEFRSCTSARVLLFAHVVMAVDESQATKGFSLAILVHYPACGCENDLCSEVSCRLPDCIERAFAVNLVNCPASISASRSPHLC